MATSKWAARMRCLSRRTLPRTWRAPAGRQMSRRQSRVSTGTTTSRSGWPLSSAYSRASTIQVRCRPARARRSACATGRAWMTSPSEESFTIAIFMSAGPEMRPGSPRLLPVVVIAPRSPRRLAEAGQDGRDQVTGRVALGIARDGHGGADRGHGGPLGHALLRVVGALGVHVGAEARDEGVRAVLLEHHDEVDAAHRGHQLRALRRRHHRAARALEA